MYDDETRGDALFPRTLLHFIGVKLEEDTLVPSSGTLPGIALSSYKVDSCFLSLCRLIELLCENIIMCGHFILD